MIFKCSRGMYPTSPELCVIRLLMFVRSAVNIAIFFRSYRIDVLLDYHIPSHSQCDECTVWWKIDRPDFHHVLSIRLYSHYVFHNRIWTYCWTKLNSIPYNTQLYSIPIVLDDAIGSHLSQGIGNVWRQSRRPQSAIKRPHIYWSFDSI